MSHASKPAWVYEVLGKNRLSAEGKSLALERKTAAILSYLALEGDTSRSKLAGLLWPGSEEATARNNLSQTLRRLRQLTGESLIIADPLRLSETLTVDVAQFRAAALSGNAAEVVSFQGELLASFDYDDLPEFGEWLWSARETLSAFREEALATLAATCETQGNLGAALKYAERLLDASPVSEAGHRLVMRLHYLLGDRPAALKAYHRCKAALERELAVTPLPETVELARLIERGEVERRSDAKPRQARTLPPQVLRPPVLVGREAAWEALEAAWVRGQTIYVTGEAGVGKTRLVQEFAASKGRALYLPAQPGYQEVLFAGAAGLSRTRIAEAPGVQLPDWVKRELSRILPEFRTHDALPPLHNEEDKLRFYQAYLEMVNLTSAGFAVVISDDTQYYDPATVELGGFMIAQRPSRIADRAAPRHLIVYRRGELSRSTQNYVDQFVISGLASRIDLSPLDAQSTTSLLVSLNLALEDGVTPQLSETIYRRTEGNALFILETLRNLIETDQLSETLPERLPLGSRVEATIQQRLERLSPTAQRVVQAAAVLQSDFDVELVAQILKSDPLLLLEVWEELERAHIVSGNRFSHALLYEAVVASMSPQVNALLNRRCAEVLAARDSTPARVAKHYLASGDDAKAAPYLVRAGQRAKEALRLVEAAERFERAGSLFKKVGDDAQAFDAYRAALKVHLEFDLSSDFEAALRRLQGMAVTPLERALVCRLKSDWHTRCSAYQQAEEEARRGLQELGGDEDTRARIELLTLLAGALARQGRSEESLAPLKQVLLLADEASEHTWLAPQLSHAAAILDDLGRNREAFGYHRRALYLERNPRRRLPQLADYGFSLLAFGDAPRALETLLEAKARLGNATTDAPVTASAVLTYLGAAQHHLRHYTEALSSYAEALALSERHHHLVQSEGTRVRRARLYLTLGRFDEAAADLEAAQRGEKPRHMYQVHLEATLGRLYALQGREHDAAKVFSRVEQRLAEAKSSRVLALVRLEQAAAVPRERRLTLAQEVFELSKGLELPALELAAYKLYAQRLLLLEDFAEAARAAQHAVTLMDTYTSVYCYPGEVLLTYYQALQAVRDPQAKAQLERCLTYVKDTAERHVPAPYRDSFLTKNPVNHAVFREAERLGLGIDAPPARQQLS